MRRWRKCRTAIHVSGLLFCLLMASQGRSGEIVSLREMAPDKACGPRCLYALMQITHEGRPECGIKCIYGLIGKEPFSVTSAKEIKDAVLKLGFSAKGYMLSVEGLAKTKGYAILPLGRGSGTAKDPLHFVLVRRVTRDYVVFVDTKTLQYRAFLTSELKDSWNGYALVITAGKGMKPLRKNDDIDGLVKLPKRGNYDEVRDFGPADKGSSLEHTFTIPQTDGKDCTAKIVQKSCSCLSARLGRDIERQNTLTMTLHVDKAGWQEAHAVVLLEPGGLIKRYAVRAYGKDAFRVHPRKAYIEAPRGGVIEYPVTIEYFTGPNDIIRFDRIAANIPDLSAGRVTSARSGERDTTTFRFDVPLIFDAGEPSAEATDIGGVVNFILNVVVRPEKLKYLPPGMNKARIVIAPEGITPSSSIVLPVSIFVRE